MSKSRALGMSPYEFKHQKMAVFPSDTNTKGDGLIDLRIFKREISEAKERMKKYKSEQGIDQKLNKFSVGDMV